jgi:hypothetical protein
MTKDDIIRMAKQAGLRRYQENLMSNPPQIRFFYEGYEEYIENFAALVAAAEREACALVCLMPVDEIQVTDDCSEYVYKDHLDCAEAIRARALHDMNQAAEKNGEEL